MKLLVVLTLSLLTAVFASYIDSVEVRSGTVVVRGNFSIEKERIFLDLGSFRRALQPKNNEKLGGIFAQPQKSDFEELELINDIDEMCVCDYSGEELKIYIVSNNEVSEN